MRRPSRWRRCAECGRKATHFAVRSDEQEPLCSSHAEQRASSGTNVYGYPPETGARPLRRLDRMFEKAAVEAERLGYRELAEATRALVQAALFGRTP
jgi:recombinational DNA repair protein (RecF pathway)